MVPRACTLSRIPQGQGSCSMVAAAVISPNFTSNDISMSSLFLWSVTGHPSALKLWEEQSFPVTAEHWGGHGDPVLGGS